MVVNPTNVYKPSCHPLLFKQTQHSQTVDRMFTGRSLQAYVVGPSGVTLPIGRCKCHKNCMTTSFIKDITIDIHRPQIPKCSLECSSNAHHQMYPKYPGKNDHGFLPAFGLTWKTTLDSSYPRNVILLCSAGLIKRIVDKVWNSRGKIFGQIY